MNKQARAAETQAITATGSRNDAEIERKANEIDKAIEQLANDGLGVRIHAIYKLKRISENNSYFHWTIMEILTAFLQEKWSYSNEKLTTDAKERHDPFPPDKNAVLTVLGSRPDIEQRKDVDEDRFLNLRYLDLSHSGIDERILNRADISNTNLKGAFLNKTSLKESYFINSILDNAKFIGADLTGAHLEDSSCIGTDFKNSNVLDASFIGANLNNANFSGAKNLTEKQIREAKSAENIVLPEKMENNF
ncbi:MAG: pentapeptide repeat-containing protein [Nitrosomonas sp.]|nr:pentapeptide repeat-containing protein [Nitrosomonas sp.]MCW5609052.1 pentapeptide repeat-containing protein [Nitrosomonas sp.]